jgi:hypothetical protein
VDTRNRAGETPLMEAAEYGDAVVAECLIAHGADVNATSPEKATPLFFAVGGQRDAIVRLLLVKGADPNKITTGGGRLLITAASLGRQDYVTWFLAAGADVNAREPSGDTALSWACQGGASLGLIQQLVSKGAKVNIVSGPALMTPLMYAAQSCKPEVLRYLVDHGAAIDPFDFEGYDALTEAALQDRPDNVRELANLGAKINRINNLGVTPLMIIAGSSGRAKVMQTLIDCGADARAHNAKGVTAAKLAESSHQWDKAEILARTEAATRSSAAK